jgi:hypothetical protein
LSCFEPLKIFRAQQRPGQIHQQRNGNNAAENQIKHCSHLLAAGDVSNQQNKHEQAVNHGNGVTHGAPTFPLQEMRATA